MTAILQLELETLSSAEGTDWKLILSSLVVVQDTPPPDGSDSTARPRNALKATNIEFTHCLHYLLSVESNTFKKCN